MKFRIYVRTNNSWSANFVDSLRKIGHQVVGIGKPTVPIKYLDTVRREQDVMHLVWAGPWRKGLKDQHHPTELQNVSYMEQGYLPHYDSITADPRGHTAKSSIPFADIPEKISISQTKELKDFLDRTYYEQYDHSVLKPYAPPAPGFILFPAQSPRDSVIMYDGGYYNKDFSKIVEHILASRPKGTKVVVKQHPKNNRLLALPRHPDVLIIDKLPPDINSTMNDYLIRNCKCVVSVNSSYILEAIARKRPVVSLGSGIFTGHGVTNETKVITPETFNNLEINSDKIDSFLYEVCLNRQIVKGDILDLEKFENFINKYIELAKEYKPNFKGY